MTLLSVSSVTTSYASDHAVMKNSPLTDAGRCTLTIWSYPSPTLSEPPCPKVPSSTSPLLTFGRLRSRVSQTVSAHVLTSVSPIPRFATWNRTWIVESSNACVGATTPDVTRSDGGSGVTLIDL